MMQKGIMPLPGVDVHLNTNIRGPISTIQSHIDAFDKGDGIYTTLPEDLARSIRSSMRCTFPEFLPQFTFLGKLNEAQIRNIPEQVKNRVLDWACRLEAAGVTGDGVSFSAEEKQLARRVVFNISNSEVGQISNDGRNIVRGRHG
jgi:hypothetical protein